MAVFDSALLLFFIAVVVVVVVIMRCVCSRKEKGVEIHRINLTHTNDFQIIVQINTSLRFSFESFYHIP